MITGERIRQVRELRGLTQTQLARKVGVKQASIAQLEAGHFQPSEKLLSSIALTTGFPPSFFSRPMVLEFSLGSLLFRARTSMTAWERMEAYRHAQFIYEIFERLAEKTTRIECRLPRLSEAASSAAKFTRAALGLSPDTPISNLIQALEKGGVLIFRLPISLENRDAFSLWIWDTNRPAIFLARDVPGDRLRFSVAHELAHLVMHSAISADVAQVEHEADEFAAELLMPEIAMRHEIVPPVTLAGMARLKMRWGVSLQALVRRAFDLSIITKRQYTSFFEQIGVRGWRTNEPGEIPVEKPRALRKMAELVYGSPISYVQLAKDLTLSPQFVRDIMEAHSEGPKPQPEQKENLGSARVLSFRRA